MGALDEEAVILRHHMQRPSERLIGVRSYWSGRLFGADITLTISRIGKVTSASTATSLISTFDVDAVVFVGVAGAIDTGLSVGDVVVATELVQHDLDARPLFEQFEIPSLGLRRVPAHTKMRELAVQAAREFLETELHEDVPRQALLDLGIDGPRVVEGLMASGDRFIHDPADGNRLHGLLPGLQCVEMEGAAVAQVCYEHDVPFTVIRVISDSANREAESAFTAFIEEAAGAYSRGILRNLLPALNEPFSASASE